MKQIILNASNRISSRLLFFLLGSLFIFSACEKNENEDIRKASGPPVIERVRLSDPTTKDSSLSQATLGSTIAIMGKNLASAQKVVFNGYALNVNPAYATENVLIIRVHDSIPTIATNPNVPDELKVINPAGEATYKFKILPPRPEVERISNEYAKAGDQITIYGRYFFFVDTVFLPGGVYVTNGFTTNANGSALTLTLPVGVNAAQGDVQVKSKSGNSAPNRSSKLYDLVNRPGMMVDWDTKTSDNQFLNTTWGIKEDNSKIVNSFGGITPLDGYFGLINMDIKANWSWANAKLVAISNNDGGVNGGTHYPKTPANVYDPEAPLSSFELKFEVASAKPIDGLIVQLVQQWETDPTSFSTSVNFKDFVKSSDGKWYTVSIDLGNLANNGNKFAKYKDFNTDKKRELRLIVQNPTTGDIPTTLAIDNIRIVRVK